VVRVAVGADGAASVVRRVVSPDFQVELAPTRVRYPRGPGPHSEASFLRLYPEVSGYLWDFPRPDHRSVGIMVTRHAWTRARMDEEIDGYLAGGEPSGGEPAVGRESGGAPPSAPDDARAGAVIGTAQLGHREYRTLAGEDFALLGDAAGLADPLTGEGIRNALRSAALLADAWREGGIRTYPQLARSAFEPEFRAARRLRRVLLDTGLGGRIVMRASRSRMARAFVAGCLNALTEGEIGVRDLTGRWWSAFRSGAARQLRP
jgi:flavin-dependent dehydrogenase